MSHRHCHPAGVTAERLRNILCARRDDGIICYSGPVPKLAADKRLEEGKLAGLENSAICSQAHKKSAGETS